MRKAAVAAIVVAALVGVGVAAVPVVERVAAGQIKAGIERDGSLTVGQVEVGLFDRRVVLTDLRSSSGADMSVGRWEATGLAWPLGELLRGRTPLAGFRWGDPLRAERIELQDVRVAGQGPRAGWSASSLVVEGFDLGRFDGSDTGPYRVPVLLARAMAALSVRRAEQRNLVFTLPGSGDTFGVAATVVEDYRSGRMAAITSAGLEATASQGRAPILRVADVEARGLDVRRIVAAFSSSDWHPDAPIGQVRVDRASASGFGGDLLSRYGVSLGEVSLETVREGDTISRSRSRIEGFVLAPPLRSMEGLQLRLVLQAMGLRELKMGFDCAGTEDRGRGEATIDRCVLLGTDLGEVNFTGHITGADEAFWRALDDNDAAALYDTKAVLAAARLVLADRSLLERGLKALAATTGQTLAVTRSNLARDIRRYQPAGVLITPGVTQLQDVVARFVEQGGTLAIDARPDPPLALDRLDYLMSPGADLVSALGLSAVLSR